MKKPCYFCTPKTEFLAAAMENIHNLLRDSTHWIAKSKLEENVYCHGIDAKGQMTQMPYVKLPYRIPMEKYSLYGAIYAVCEYMKPLSSDVRDTICFLLLEELKGQGPYNVSNGELRNRLEDLNDRLNHQTMLQLIRNTYSKM